MDYISGWCTSKRRLDGMSAIVTGSNAGIGKETARDFYLRGAQVIMGCRDIKKGEEAKTEIETSEKEKQGTGSLKVEKLDLSSLQSVREFAAKVLASEENIQILVNNAGVMMSLEGRTEDGFETHIGTNHFGHALLTLLLLPRFKKSAPSRVIFVSSLLHRTYDLDLNDINFEKTRYHPLQAYGRSKSANVIFARSLARKLKEHGINDVTTYSVHPGVIATGIARNFSDTWYGTTWIFDNVLSWFVKSVKCGAQTSVYCAVDEKCADQSGLYYSDCKVATSSRQGRDDEAADKLWDLTLEMLKLGKFNPLGDSDPL